MKRFQVVTYSWDIGIDDKRDFDSIHEAIKEAKRFRTTEEYAAIYDSALKITYVVFGHIGTKVFADYIATIPIDALTFKP